VQPRVRRTMASHHRTVGSAKSTFLLQFLPYAGHQHHLPCVRSMLTDPSRKALWTARVCNPPRNTSRWPLEHHAHDRRALLTGFAEERLRIADHVGGVVELEYRLMSPSHLLFILTRRRACSCHGAIRQLVGFRSRGALAGYGSTLSGSGACRWTGISRTHFGRPGKSQPTPVTR
jgi:hypothetical protein